MPLLRHAAFFRLRYVTKKTSKTMMAHSDFTLASHPIPISSPSPTWQRVPITECGEPLVDLKEQEGRHPLMIIPQYHAQGIEGALPTCLVRERVAEMLVAATRWLPRGWRLVVWDGWRPFHVQDFLFRRYYKHIDTEFPEMPQEEKKERTSAFISLPSRRPCCPSPHLTGGAVDVALMDEQDRYAPMGTSFDDFSPRAHTRYYEEEPGLGPDERLYLHNRRMLYWAMIQAGFSNYPEEWWHFDYGNQMWAARAGTPWARYGVIFPFSNA